MKKAKTKPPAKPVIEEKLVKHTFTNEELNDLGSQLAHCHGALRGIEAEFDQVKASFKARVAEAVARIDRLATNINDRSEMRMARCRVEMDPKAGNKYFYLEHAPKNAEPVITEAMQPYDYQGKLPLSEKEEPPLFNPAFPENTEDKPHITTRPAEDDDSE